MSDKTGRVQALATRMTEFGIAFTIAGEVEQFTADEIIAAAELAHEELDHYEYEPCDLDDDGPYYDAAGEEIFEDDGCW